MSKSCENSWLCGRFSGSITFPDIGVSSIRIRHFEMPHQDNIKTARIHGSVERFLVQLHVLT